MKKFTVRPTTLAFGFCAVLLYCLHPGTQTLAASPKPAHQPIMMHFHGENGALDFTLVNRTGYDITQLFIGKSGNKEWHDSDEVTIPSGTIADGTQLHLTFSPKQQYEVWDIYVKFEDNSDAEFDKLNLTTIDKVTLHYNRKTNETTYETE